MTAEDDNDNEESSQRAALRELLPDFETDSLYESIEQIRSEAKVFGGEPKFDRFVLRDRIDRGGMGVVYRVYDPKFDREFALKVLTRRVDGDDKTSPGMKLFREATNMTLVHGEHVVRVYDAGLFESHPWFVMEYVEGETLEEWLQKETRPWPEVVARFVEAARGLRAVHKVDLVHCDFKPRNVVLEQRSGQAMVIDFGLAQPAAGAPAGEHERTDVNVVFPRRVAGTRPFMSPEQRRGQPIGKASDQFSFFVSLHWGLYGELPFGEEVTSTKARAAEPRPHVLPPRPAVADKRGVPRWLHRVIIKGLAESPEDRHTSMDAVIHELTRDRGRTPKLAVSAVGLFAVGIGAAAYFIPSAHDLAAMCSGSAGEVRQLVDRVRAQPQAAEVLPALDRFAASWETHYRGACEAHHLRGEGGLELRRRCLTEGRKQLEYLVEDLPTLSPEQLRTAVRELETPALCDAERLDEERPIVDEAQRLAVEEVRETVARARHARVTQDFAASYTLAHQAVERAREVGHAPTIAEALLAAGKSERDRDDADGAHRTMEDATQEAGRGRTVFTAIKVFHELARVEILDLKDARRGGFALSVANGRLAGLDWDLQPRLPCPADDGACLKHARAWAEHQDLRGLLAHLELDYGASIAHHDGALKVWQVLAPEVDYTDEVHASALNLGRSYLQAGQYEEAEAALELSLRTGLQAYGEEHPEIADTLLNQALLWSRRGDRGKADAIAARAAGLYAKKQAGPSLGVATAELHRGSFAIDAGEPEVAREHAKRADVEFSKIPQAPQADVRQARQIVAVSHWMEGNCEAAVPRLRPLIVEFSQQVDRRWQCDAALDGAYLGGCLTGSEANREFEKAAVALERAGGARGCVAGFELARAQCERWTQDHEKDHTKVIKVCESALTMVGGDAVTAAEIRWNLAQNIILAGGDAKRAHAEARTAYEIFKGLGEDGEEEAVLIDRWLKRHPGD